MASVAVVTCAAAGPLAIAYVPREPAPAAHSGEPSTARTSLASAATAASGRTVASGRKGVSARRFPGVTQALAESGASWYYTWGATPFGIVAPAHVSFVPMIWSAADVNAATLDEVRREGHILLGFNEPDLWSQSNMSVSEALALWPRLMATGMTLGSPAVADGAANPDGWLGQFMAGVQARHYRVNFIAVHWYGGDFVTREAVQQLKSYLEAIRNRYHRPIWLTEFALIGWWGSTPVFPAEAQQAAFLSAATRMLDGLSYVQRYAWFTLPASSGYGTTGLFNPGPSATEVGFAFEAAR